MATAIVSLVRDEPVSPDVGMTGEITLTGQVLPIGGLKEKALVAQRNEITTIIAPALNERDIEDIPEHLRNDLDFVFVEEIGEVLTVALEPQGSANGRRRSRAAAQSRV
jgi:ATP-dependent Lon protease